MHDELLSGRRSEDALPPLFHLGVHHVLSHVRGRLGGEGDCERRHRGVDAPDAAHRTTPPEEERGTITKKQGVKNEHEERFDWLEIRKWDLDNTTRRMVEKAIQGCVAAFMASIGCE